MAKMTTRGRITIPKDVREKLRPEPGDRVHFVALPDGTIRLMVQNLPITALKGMLGKPKRSLPGRALDDAIRDTWGIRWRRFERSRLVKS